ncbi:MAG: AbrB/MazE/SpoVT family DNA-binding domain-containing protein [Acidobacteria bacterium]|nr:AbrB/MazE/SpoVT family DNA-binding domain-containing protein [Acidobacteriota bacterium]
MAKVTSKLQVTLPKAIATLYGIEPGDEIEFQAAGDVIRVIPPRRRARTHLSLEERLRLFDRMVAEQQDWQKQRSWPTPPSGDRGWRREELYTRGESD